MQSPSDLRHALLNSSVLKAVQIYHDLLVKRVYPMAGI